MGFPPTLGRFALVAFGLLALAGIVSAQLPVAGWPKAGGGALNRSISPAVGTYPGILYEYPAPSISGAITGPDGSVYFGNGQDLISFDPQIAVNNWAFAGFGNFTSTPAIGVNGLVYAGNQDSNVYALNSATGTLMWKTMTNGPVVSGIAIGPDGTVYAGSQDGAVYALNPTTGAVIWSYQTGGPINTSPAVGPDGTVYVTSNSGLVFALYGPTGFYKWAYVATENCYAMGNPVLDANGNLDFTTESGAYQVSADGVVTSLNPASGSVVWSRDGLGGNIQDLCAENNVLYVASEGVGYALNATTGVINWQVALGYVGAASKMIAPIVAGDGTIYIPYAEAGDSGLTAVSPSGSALWVTHTDIGAGPISMGSDGMLYVPSTSGLFVFASFVNASLSTSPSSVPGGTVATGTIALPSIQSIYCSPMGDMHIALNSSSANIGVGSSVLIPAGSPSPTLFPIATRPSGSSVTGQISVTYAGATHTANLTALAVPLQIAAVSLNPASVFGGSSSVGTVSLNYAAPSGGASVTLRSQSPNYVSVPSSVTVPAGATSATFTISTTAYSSNYTNSIKATIGSSSQSATLSVLKGGIQSIGCTPTRVTGGFSTQLQVNLAAPAPTGGWTVKLATQSTYYVSVPASLTIPAGAMSGTVTVTTRPYSQSYTNVITASDPATTASTTLTIDCDSVQSFTVNPTTVTGNAGTTGTITLTSVAPPNGWSVFVTSQRPSYVGVPATISFAPGVQTANFVITTNPYSATYTCLLAASDGNSKQTTTLTVQP